MPTNSDIIKTAEKFLGIREIPGKVANPRILEMLQLDNSWPTDDAVPWCSAFVNFVAWLLDLPRSKDLRARSWLTVGKAVPDLSKATLGDVLVFKRRATDSDTGINGQGHVGFLYGLNDQRGIRVLGGNQSDSVKVATYPKNLLIGIRRLT